MQILSGRGRDSTLLRTEFAAELERRAALFGVRQVQAEELLESNALLVTQFKGQLGLEDQSIRRKGTQ